MKIPKPYDPNDPDHLPAWLTKGAVIRIPKVYEGSRLNHGATRIHIRGVVDGEVVFCFWRFQRGYWDYMLMPYYILADYIKEGNVQVIRKGNQDAD